MINRILLHVLVSGAVLCPIATLAQPTPAKKVDGVWIFWGLLPGQTKPNYVGTATFEKDGMLSGSGAGTTTGRWERTGNQEFAFTFLANTYDTSGTYTGTNRVRGMMTLADDGASCTGKTLLEILDPSGAVIFTAPGPTTFTGLKVLVTPF